MVEWKKLGEVCEIGTGSNNREDACDNGCYPFYVRSQEVLKIDSYSYDEEAILIPGEGGIGDIFHYINGKYGLHQRTYRVHPITDDVKGRYIYYFLFANFKTYINAKSYKSTAASIRKPMLLDFPIPIPSLEEQTRIVGILDTFTSAIDNLKEQIAQRRKQYEYYRDQLLDLEGKEGVEMKRIGEVSYISDYVSNGSFASLRENVTYKSEPDYAVLIRFVDYSNGFDKNKFVYIDEHAYNFLSKSSLNGGEIIMSNVGSCGLLFRCPKLGCKMSLAPNSILIKSEFIDYLYYWLSTNKGQSEIKQITSKSAMPKFNKTEFKKILVPIPSLSVQNRIVSILDTFEDSIQNLEKQLKQRQKQYEYYRNKLLTFE